MINQGGSSILSPTPQVLWLWLFARLFDIPVGLRASSSGQFLRRSVLQEESYTVPALLFTSKHHLSTRLSLSSPPSPKRSTSSPARLPRWRNLLRGSWSVSTPLSSDLQHGLSPSVSLLPGSSSSFVLSRYHINPSNWFVIIFTKNYNLNADSL